MQQAHSLLNKITITFLIAVFHREKYHTRELREQNSNIGMNSEAQVHDDEVNPS